MDYQPINDDVLGLSEHLFKKDLISELDNIMAPPSDIDSLRVNFNFYEEQDGYLATIRADAFDDFRFNGIEQDLDDVDMYQSRLREMSSVRPVETGNRVLRDYTSSKQRKSKKRPKTVCVFCKNNNEAAAVYQSHSLKDNEGRVTCPILRKYTCPICGVSGDNAHTIRYCPRNTDKDLFPRLDMLMKSPSLSTVKPRYVQY